MYALGTFALYCAAFILTLAGADGRNTLVSEEKGASTFVAVCEKIDFELRERGNMGVFAAWYPAHLGGRFEASSSVRYFGSSASAACTIHDTGHGRTIIENRTDRKSFRAWSPAWPIRPFLS